VPVDDSKNFNLNKNERCSTYLGWTEIIVRTADSMLPPPLSEPFVAGHQKELKTGFLGMGAK
jgi:hypothetical protein